jgi:hypothetical protein
METLLYVAHDPRKHRPVSGMLQRLWAILGQNVDMDAHPKTARIPGSAIGRWLVLEGRAHGYFGPPHFIHAASFIVWYLAAEFFDAHMHTEMWYVDEYHQHYIRFDKPTRDNMLARCPLAHATLCRTLLDHADAGHVHLTLLDHATTLGTFVPGSADDSGAVFVLPAGRQRIDYSCLRNLHVLS